MALVGTISGSATQDHKIGLTGSVIIGQPAQNEIHLPEIGTDVILFVSGSPGGRGVSTDSAAKRKSTAVIGGDLVVSGNSYLADGAVTAPSLAFAEDTNTGIWRSAGDKLNISVGGEEVVEISSSALSGSEIETGTLFSNSGDLEIVNDASDKDIIFTINDGGTERQLLALDGDQGVLRIGNNTSIGNIAAQFGGTNDYISGSITPGHGLGLAVKGTSIWLSGTQGVYFGKRTGTGNQDSVGDDVAFFVSGGIDARDPSVGMNGHRGVAVFGGDLVTSGAVHALGDATIGDDLTFSSDGAKLSFGVNGEVTLLHVHDTGLLLSDASGVGDTKLMFGDSATFIQQQADGQLGIDADSVINITAPTIDIDASSDVNVSSTMTVEDKLTVNAPIAIIGDTISETTLNIKGVGSQEGALLNIQNSSEDDKFIILSDDQSHASGSDIVFFTSGAVGSRGSSVRGTSLFGGDLVVSGNSCFMPGGASPGTDARFFVSGSTHGEEWDDRGSDGHGVIVLAGDTWVSASLVIYDPTSKEHMFAFGNTPEAAGADTTFFVSGCIQGKDDELETDGIAVFGGDLVVSGASYFNLSGETGQLRGVGQDVGLFVSGSTGGSAYGEQYSGVTLIGGDLVVSGYLNAKFGGPKADWETLIVADNMGAYGASGDFIYFGNGVNGSAGGSATAKRLYYMGTDGHWRIASASAGGGDGAAASSSMLAIGLGGDIYGNGVMIKGYIEVEDYFSGTWVSGQVVYLASGTNGSDAGAQYCDAFSLPGESGQFIRSLGYMTPQQGVLFFDPSNDWIELA
jgi:hypothetical protein